jgi:hypothetical protein
MCTPRMHVGEWKDKASAADGGSVALFARQRRKSLQWGVLQKWSGSFGIENTYYSCPSSMYSCTVA